MDFNFTSYKSLKLLLRNKRRVIVYLVILVIGLPTVLYAQNSSWRANAEVGCYGSTGGQLPFWLRANNWGVVPLSGPVLASSVGLYYQFRPDTTAKRTSSFRSKISWGGGHQLVYNTGSERNFLLPESFLKVQWKFIELMAGRRKDVIGIVDTLLTSGSYSFSGNSMPVPKVQLSFPEYVPLRFLNNFVAVKGFYNHGWFNTPYIKGAYLHQKALHLRLGAPGRRLHVELGLNQNATWGGHADYLKGSDWAVNGRLTDSFGDYLWGVVLGKIPKQYHNSRFTNFDGENRVGNHVGNYDLAVTYSLQKSKLLFYHQHPYEDASGLAFRNFPDGLYGLSFKNRAASNDLFQLRGVVFEFLTTLDQSGGAFTMAGTNFKGNDNYFDHAQYAEGWSYFSKGMGTPFLSSRPGLNKAVTEWREFFPNNRVMMYHVGFEGLVASKLRVLGKFSISRNYGNFNKPFPETISQFSSWLNFDWPLFAWGNTRLSGQVAYDEGGLYPKSIGGYVGIKTSAWKK